MYERAKFYSGRFIYGGITWLVLSAFLIYPAFFEGKALNPNAFVMFWIAIVWLYFAYMINKKLKSKDGLKVSVEISDKKISYKKVEDNLSVLVLIAILLSCFSHWKYADYLVIPVLIAYIGWFQSQMKLINNYFKS